MFSKHLPPSLSVYLTEITAHLSSCLSPGWALKKPCTKADLEMFSESCRRRVWEGVSFGGVKHTSQITDARFS